MEPVAMRNRYGWRRAQRGAVAIITALSLVVLVGFAGLALDGGHLYLTKTELQNGADACALSASYELTGAPIPAENFTRAENAGKTVGAENRVDFQGDEIDPATIEVSFSTSLAAASWFSAGSASGNSKYVRCTIERTGIVPWFMQVLGFGRGHEQFDIRDMAAVADQPQRQRVPAVVSAVRRTAGDTLDPPAFRRGQGAVTRRTHWPSSCPPRRRERTSSRANGSICGGNVGAQAGQA